MWVVKTIAKVAGAVVQGIVDIAKRHFFVETLDTRNSDGLDFHDVAVWSIRAALIEAYAAGLAAAKR